MTPERWDKVREIFQEALRHAPGERPAFLNSECAEDESLRNEVSSLIAAHEKEGSFIDSPGYPGAASVIANRTEMEAGHEISHYKIISTLGKGGMGEVYLAEDTKLHRRVAIKVLSSDSIANEEANHRLLREAQAAAKLDHPNICAVYEVAEEDGRAFIIMTYVEGETLDVRMKRKPLELSESLTIATQIADAIAEAHTQGIVHRDIKPANVIITPRGQPKVMDFGLAKLQPAIGTGGSSSVPEAVAEAHRATELSPAQTISLTWEGYALAKAGKPNEARAIIDKLLKLSQEPGRWVPPYHLALIYNGLGNTDESILWLNKALEQRDPKIAFLKMDRTWNNLRNDVRFQDVMKRAGF